jgi:steroid delta-isomerase-like uncharacterized protein
MHYNFAVKWLKAFRSSPDEVCALYEDDGFVFEDVMLDQHNINNKPDLLRLFALYANKDRTNGLGVHNFRIRAYIGDERSGLIRWEWSPEDAGTFIGMDVAGKPFMTQGHTYHQYNEAGHIVRESSWWDAAAIVRQVGLAPATKHPAGLSPSTATTGDTASPATGMDHAKQWCHLLGTDTAALASLYADYFTIEASKVDDHETDTLTDRSMLAEQLGGLASGENGVYTFTATEYLGDERYGLIHWDVTIEGATTFRGLPTDGKTLKTTGSTFHQFDAEGKILLESTCWEDNGVFIELGLPILRPHYWREDFDLAAFVASLGG